MKLAINLATRNRPKLLLNTIMTTAVQISRPDTVFMVSVDEDDRPTIDMLKPAEGYPLLSGRLLISVKPREDTVAEKWNRVIAEVPDADLYMTMCDDGPILTAGFDQRIIDAATWHDGIGCVTNWLENLTFPGVQAVTRRLVELMDDKIYVEHFPYWFVDHWLLDITRMIGRDAFADVRLDCVTNRNAGGPTMEMREPGWWATFYDAMHLERRRQAERIIRNMDETDAHKARLVGYFPRWEQHSTMINNGARAMRPNDPPHDDRYRRIKAKAVETLKGALEELQDDERRRAA